MISEDQMQAIYKIIKAILPPAAIKLIRPFGHGFLAYAAALSSGFPSRKLVVIGVTGTAGKSTTVQMLAKILNTTGHKTGYITTVSFFDGDAEFVNRHGMSMPSGSEIQNSLQTMLNNKCRYAIIEATSEGLAQNRHLGTGFNAVLVTNISPAHIEAHGSFESYRNAKLKLLGALKRRTRTIIGLNLDDENVNIFASQASTVKFGIAFEPSKEGNPTVHVYKGLELEVSETSKFRVGNVQFKIPLPGRFNAYNALMASACASEFGVKLEDCAQALMGFKEVAGRMQQISNTKGVKIYLDYAPEPAGMRAALETVHALPHKRLIHVFGSTGGHRDIGKRFEFGDISSQYADIIIITNDDVYDSEPVKIAGDIKTGIERNDKRKKNQQILEILDRREAIKHACEMLEEGDILIFTGKGSEQFLVLPGNQRIEWDEKKVIEGYL